MEKTQHSKMRWLWENMKGYRAIYFVGIIGTLVYNVMQLIVPYITQMIVDLFLTGEDAVKNLSTNAKIMIATECSNPRAMKADELAEICKKFCKEVYTVQNPFEAIDLACEKRGDKLLAVCGSLYLASQVREYLKTK